MQLNKTQVSKGALWTMLASFVSLSIKLVSIPILARLLLPEDFGLVAVSIAFLMFCATCLGRGGMGAAIVFHDKALVSFVDSAFWFNLIIGCVFGIGVALYAEEISRLLGVPGAHNYLFYLSFCFPLLMVDIVGRSLLVKDMRFNYISRAMMIASAVSVCFALGLAYQGYGAWSLVVQQLVSSFLMCVLFLYFSGYRPSIAFSFRSLLVLRTYILSNVVSDIFIWISTEGPLMLVSKLAGAQSAGRYAVIARLVFIPREMLGNGLSNALFSGFMGLDDKGKYEGLLWAMKLNIYCLGGVFLALAAQSNVIIPFVLGDNFGEYWQVFMFLCLGMALVSPLGGMFPYLKATNKLKLMINLAGFRAIVTLISVLTGWYLHNDLVGIVLSLMLGQCVFSIFALLICIHITPATFKSLFSYLAPAMAVIVIMGLSINSSISFLSLYGNDILSIIVSSLVGMFFYLLTLRAVSKGDFFALKGFVLKRFKWDK